MFSIWLDRGDTGELLRKPRERFWTWRCANVWTRMKKILHGNWETEIVNEKFDFGLHAIDRNQKEDTRSEGIWKFSGVMQALGSQQRYHIKLPTFNYDCNPIDLLSTLALLSSEHKNHKHLLLSLSLFSTASNETKLNRNLLQIFFAS